jgi:hypothetical protein
MIRRSLLAACALVGLGCTAHHPVNANPFTVSTAPFVTAPFEAVGLVSVRQCNQFIVVVPIIKDPSHLFEALFAEAERVGGTAVVGVEVRPVDYLVVPFYGRFCYEATGTAVRPKPVEMKPAPARKKKK